MPKTPSWRFVDGDMPGDGALWLEHPTELWGFIAIKPDSGATETTIMVAAKSWVEKSIADIGRGALYSVFSQMMVVPDGTPDQMRATIDSAVQSGTLSRYLTAGRE